MRSEFESSGELTTVAFHFDSQRAYLARLRAWEALVRSGGSATPRPSRGWPILADRTGTTYARDDAGALRPFNLASAQVRTDAMDATTRGGVVVLPAGEAPMSATGGAPTTGSGTPRARADVDSETALNDDLSTRTDSNAGEASADLARTAKEMLRQLPAQALQKLASELSVRAATASLLNLSTSLQGFLGMHTADVIGLGGFVSGLGLQALNAALFNFGWTVDDRSSPGEQLAHHFMSQHALSLGAEQLLGTGGPIERFRQLTGGGSRLGALRVGDADQNGNKILNGSQDVLVNGRRLARVGDPVDKGGRMVYRGAAFVVANARYAARVTSESAAPAEFALGSDDVFVGGIAVGAFPPPPMTGGAAACQGGADAAGGTGGGSRSESPRDDGSDGAPYGALLDELAPPARGARRDGTFGMTAGPLTEARDGASYFIDPYSRTGESRTLGELLDPSLPANERALVFVNGINTTLEEAAADAERIAVKMQRPVILVYNAKREGIPIPWADLSFNDLFGAVVNRVGQYANSIIPAEPAQNTLAQILAATGGDVSIWAHSEGNILLSRAFASLEGHASMDYSLTKITSYGSPTTLFPSESIHTDNVDPQDMVPYWSRWSSSGPSVVVIDDDIGADGRSEGPHSRDDHQGPHYLDDPNFERADDYGMTRMTDWPTTD